MILADLNPVALEKAVIDLDRLELKFSRLFVILQIKKQPLHVWMKQLRGLDVLTIL